VAGVSDDFPGPAESLRAASAALAAWRWEGAHMASSLTVDILVSADGLAGSDGLPGYFGYLGPELQEWIMAELAAPQLVIMGRRTYQALASLPEEAHGKSWGRTAELGKVVFSRTLNHAAWPSTRICSRDLVDEIQDMKAGGSIPLRTWGSLSLARQLIRAGLVDRLRLMTFPLIAGPSGRDAAFADMTPPTLNWPVTGYWMAGCSWWSTGQLVKTFHAPEPSTHAPRQGRGVRVRTHMKPSRVVSGCYSWSQSGFGLVVSLASSMGPGGCHEEGTTSGHE